MKRNLTRTIPMILAMAVALSFAGACKKKPPTTTEGARPSEAPSRPGNETQVSPPSGSQPQNVTSETITTDANEANKRGYLKDAFFDYNKSDLRDDARTALSANADWLKAHTNWQFLIEGHCDDRGTTEYNLALGDRRANAARDYLVSLGIDAARIRTVSYGKERPFCTEETEDCWQQNRRAHFLFTASR
jgi:peptidoglycan-associated lipoprotein